MIRTDFSSGWREIEPVIQKLHRLLDSKLPVDENVGIKTNEYSSTYTKIYNMCIDKENSNNQHQLYDAFQNQVRIFLKEKILNPTKVLRGEQLLRRLVEEWTKYQTFLHFMLRFFTYLEKSYIEHNNLSKLKYLGYVLYLRIVHEHLKGDIIVAFQNEIQKDRDNYKADLPLLLKVSELFADIFRNENKESSDTYFCLGKAIVDHARMYYQQKFSEWSEKCSCEEYIINIRKLQEDEQLRFSKSLSKNFDTQKQISNHFNQELVLKYRTALLTKENGFIEMLQNNKFHILERVYTLFKGLNDDFDEIKQSFQEWVQKIGNDTYQQKIQAALSDVTDPKKKKFATDHDFVERIFREFSEIRSIITKVFNSDPAFQMSFKLALGSFLNIEIEVNYQLIELFSNQIFKDYGMPELLANYTDYILKKVNLSEEDLEKKLEEIMDIFNHLSEKDIYLTLYQQQLAIRLLNLESGGVSRYEDESLMITKIKGICGQGQETKNFEGMINDIKLTVDIKKEFQDYMITNNCTQSRQTEVYVKVLQEANWPVYKNIIVTLPPQALPIIEDFKKFYLAKKKNQKLIWMNSLGSFDIKMNITADKTYIVNVSPTQLAILLHFEKNNDWIPQKVLIEEIGLEKNLPEFQREINPLVSKRILISSKQRKDEKKDAEEEFKFNTDFAYKTKKFSTVVEAIFQRFKRDIVNDNREHAVEATIVRVMKSRKTMAFNDLVADVHSQMRKFKTNLNQIKKRIESLVEREYIERDKNDINIYHYKS